MLLDHYENVPFFDYTTNTTHNSLSELRLFNVTAHVVIELNAVTSKKESTPSKTEEWTANPNNNTTVVKRFINNMTVCVALITAIEKYCMMYEQNPDKLQEFLLYTNLADYIDINRKIKNKIIGYFQKTGFPEFSNYILK
jgi:hypothetical protein